MWKHCEAEREREREFSQVRNILEIKDSSHRGLPLEDCLDRVSVIRISDKTSKVLTFLKNFTEKFQLFKVTLNFSQNFDFFKQLNGETSQASSKILMTEKLYFALLIFHFS